MNITRESLRPPFDGFVGEAPGLLEALVRASEAAPTRWPVLVTGETGTGKTALAEAIHKASGRGGRFVAVNCAALAPNLVESELFGHRRGAYTGAERDSAGLFESANGGTLFLDEIGDLALDAQAKVLRVIETGLVRRLGSDRETPVDVRIIAATHQPLSAFIAVGRFREDLYYRINGFVVHLPPLRERGPGDLELLAESFLHAEGGNHIQLDPSVILSFAQHEWPGNLRELQSVLRRALIRSGGARVLTPSHLPPPDEVVPRSPALPQAVPPNLVDSTTRIGSSSNPAMHVPSGASSGILPAAKPPDPQTQLTETLREALGAGPDNAGAWAVFLLAFHHQRGPTMTRTDMVALLREIRGRLPSNNVLQLEWKRDIRPQLLEHGFVTDGGRKLTINAPACREAVHAAAGGAPMPGYPSDAVPLSGAPIATDAIGPTGRPGGSPASGILLPGEPGSDVPPPLRPPTPASAADTLPIEDDPVARRRKSRPKATDRIRRTNLPATETSLIGREADIERLTTMLTGDNQLVTLTGPGGIGKSALGVRLGQHLLRQFPGGVWMTSLTDCRTIHEVAAAVARTLEVPDSDDLVRDVSRGLRSRPQPTLLILDSFEQCVGAATETIGRWVRGAPGVRVLVTSRSLLGVSREQRYEVLPLGIPPGPRESGALSATTAALVGQFDSVRLLLERGKAARPDLRLTDDNALAVATICHGLSGIPLAIELAAARLKVMQPEQLAHRLARKFEVLRSRDQDRPGHQRTLSGTMDWSFELLEPDEQAVFIRLAVFHSGFTLEAAEEVLSGDPEAGMMLDALESLLEKSLIRFEETFYGPRYHCYAIVREYGEQLLAERLEARALDNLYRRHAEYFATVGEEWHHRIRFRGGEPALQALKHLEGDRDNVMAARDYAQSVNDPVLAARLTLVLVARLLERGGMTIGLPWIEYALGALPESERELRMKLFFADMRLRIFLTMEPPGDLDDRIAWLREHLDEDFATWAPVLADGLRIRAWIHNRNAHYEPTVADASAAADLYRQLGYPTPLADTLCAWSEYEYEQAHDRDKALDLLDQAEQEARKDGATKTLGRVLGQRGQLLGERGELDEGLRMLEEARRVCSDNGARALQSWFTNWYCDLLLTAGQYDEARHASHEAESLGRTTAVALQANVARVIRARALAMLGQVDESLELIDRVLADSNHLAPLIRASAQVARGEIRIMHNVDVEGGVDDVRSYIADESVTIRRTHERFQTHAWLAAGLARLGRTNDAAEAAAIARAEAAEHGYGPDHWHADVARAAAALDDAGL